MWEEEEEEEEEEKDEKEKEGGRTKEPLTAVLEGWLLSIPHCRFHKNQWLICRYFAGNSEFAPEIFGNHDVSTGVETDGKLKGRCIFVTRSLVPLSGGPSMMSPRLSPVEVDAGGCWSRHLIMVIFVFR